MGIEDNPTQVLLTLLVMIIQFAYLIVFRPLSSPLKMTVELVGAGCECITVLLTYWLIDKPDGRDAVNVLQDNSFHVIISFSFFFHSFTFASDMFFCHVER